MTAESRQMIDPLTSEEFDLNTTHGVALARNRVLRQAKANSDQLAIDQILSNIIAAQPMRLQEQVERLDNCVEMGDHKKANEYLAELNARFLGIEKHLSPREAMLLLRSIFRLGHDDQALKLADNLRSMDGDAQLSFIILRVYDRAGRIDRILEISDDLYAKSTDRPKLRAKLFSCLTNAGYTSKIFELSSGNVELSAENVIVALQVARAHLRARPTDEAGLKLLEDVHAFDPENDEVRLTLSKGYLQFGREKEALEILELEPGQPIVGAESWRQHVAETFMANDLFAEAGWIYRDLLRENPLHSGWRRAGIGALVQAGETSKATAMYEEDRMRRRISPHVSFVDCLNEIDGKLDEAPIPPVRFDWAYKKLQQINAAPNDRAKWEDASRRVYLADALTIDWLETRTEDSHQVVDQFRNPEAALHPIKSCLESGQGAFIAALHMGSMFAGPALLQAHGIDFKWLASTPSVSTMPGGDKLLSTSSMGPLSITRSVFRTVRSGKAIVVAIDGAVASASRPVSFLGDNVLMTDIVPRTVFQTGVRSFFPKIVWHGNEISLEFMELIPPSKEDTVESYVSVWFRDFMECVAEMCLEAPDNMRLAGGFWTHLAI